MLAFLDRGAQMIDGHLQTLRALFDGALRREAAPDQLLEMRTSQLAHEGTD